MSNALLQDHAPGLEVCLFPDVREESYIVDSIEGDVPGYIRGHYYLNGPAKFERGDLKYRNWLDGDGMVCCLRFDDGQIRFTNRFVRGRKFQQEEEQGRAVFATFGTRFDGDKMRRGIATESPYNVSVYRYRDALIAFGEQSVPLELNPETLETMGEFDFDRQLNSLSPFSAHPKIDSRSGEFMNFGISFAGRQPLVNYYRFDANGVLACRKRATLDHACSIHDFAVSEHYAVIYLSPYVLDASAMMGEGKSTMDALEWRPELGGTLLVLNRMDGEEVARISIGDRYCLHTINCFEDANRLVLDVIELERPVYDQYQVLPDMFNDVPFGWPVRITMELETRRVVDRQQLDYHGAPDFPAIDPKLETQAYDDFWMLGIGTAGRPGRKFLDTLVHANWNGAIEEYRCPSGCYVGGEPVFIADPHDASGGAVMCQEMDSNGPTSSFVIFRACDVSHGPIARLRLRTPVHFGFHASFYAR
ncbi:MAG: carotenoid oxygenase family protein [Planctomycetota bacterium]|nr:carotenoid oxygenase family protein [Planctomycetota bacterium]